jgi:large subunit ribosomal protein L32e
LDPARDAARLAHTVGTRKRKEIIAKAEIMHIKILNAGNLSAKKDKEEKEEEKP